MNRHVVAVYASAVALSLIGIAFIYSASSYSAAINAGDAFFYVKKQAIAFAAGLVYRALLAICERGKR